MNRVTNKIVTIVLLSVVCSSIYSMKSAINDTKRVLDLTNLSDEKQAPTTTRNKKRSAQQAGLRAKDTEPKRIKVSDGESKVSNNKPKEKRFSCTYCSKKFVSNSHLVNHIRVHTKEKPFSCNECYQSFAILGTLKTHMQVHHIGEKPFVCDECNKGFIKKSHLDIHKWTHSEKKPFSCDECGKEFTQSSHLTQHRLIHEDKKPFACDQCDKRFVQKPNLTAHMRTHTGERPYSCKQCDKSFKQKSHLTKHEKIHAREKHTVADDFGTIADDSGVTVGIPVTTPVVMATVVSQNMLYKKVT